MIDVEKMFETNHQISSKRWFRFLYGVKFSDWNTELLKHTFPIEYVTLTRDELLMICEPDTKQDYFASAHSKIDAAMQRLRDIGYTAFFPKLISRSPKDFLLQDNSTMMPLTTSHEVLEALSCSERCFEDAIMLSNLNIENNLIIRPFIRIDPNTEWRCFIKDNSVIAISRYYYQKSATIQNPVAVKERILGFLNDVVIPNIITHNFVADLIVIEDKVFIIETNHYGLSDPCIFLSYENIESGDLKTVKFTH